MLELPHYVKTVLKHCLVASIMLMLVAQCQGGTVLSNPTAVTGNDISAPTNKAEVEDRSNKNPGWFPLVQCIFLADINKCLQDRTVRGLMGIEGKDIQIDANKGTVKVPGEPEEGIFEVIGDLMSDGISRFFQDDDKAEEDEDDDDDDDEDENNDTVKSADNGDGNSIGSASSRTNSLMEKGNRAVETGRIKKIKRLVKFAQVAAIIFLVGAKFAFMLLVLGKLMQFKLLILVAINTLINLLHLWLGWKKQDHHHETPIVHFEEAHHEHLHDDHHFKEAKDDKGWLGGLWSRNSVNGARLAQPHELAYSAYKPVAT